jgi:2'-hydroxyisoflavone reductase
MKILILGGTSFLGPHQIAYALDRGHSITTFTRGKSKPTVHLDLFDQVEQLIGDRENDLSALETGEWDVVIDNSGHNLEWTKNSAELLKERVKYYMFTSSTGVYYPYLTDEIDEETPLLTEEPEGIEDEEMKMEYWYGVMKTNSELAAIDAFGEDRTIIVRPTYMIGPGDKSDRFIYWPVRLAKGGEIMVPGKKEDPVQYVDVRDVAEWMIRLAEDEVTGKFNAAGPRNNQTTLEFIDEAKAVFDVESTIVHIDDYEFLKENDVHYIVPWVMPEGNNYGSSRSSITKSLNSGLSLRNVKDSVNDIYDWWYSDALTDERRNQFEQKPGSILLREPEIIAKWKQRGG